MDECKQCGLSHGQWSVCRTSAAFSYALAEALGIPAYVLDSPGIPAYVLEEGGQ